jgi:hypothetical protein
MSFKSENNSFGNIYLLHVNLVIVGMEIMFDEELNSLEIIQEFINDKNGELILDYYFFKILNVRKHAPSALFS